MRGKKASDMSGQRFGKLVVTGKALSTGYGSKTRARWLCTCDCGIECVKIGYQLRSGHTRSCGCLTRQVGVHSRNWSGVGELSGSFWCNIIHGARARGLDVSITIDEAWDLFQRQGGRCALSGVELNFRSRKGVKDQTASLDRIDSGLPYCLSNVQWVHKSVQLMKNDLVQEGFVAWCTRIAEVAARQSEQMSLFKDLLSDVKARGG